MFQIYIKIEKSIFLFLILTGIILTFPNGLLAFTLKNSVITDEAGRKIVVKKPFKRIISLYGAHTENLFFLKSDKFLIGVSKNETYPEGAKKIKSYSYHDGPERFLAAKPDLVLIRPLIDRGYSSLMKRLEKSSITVISIQPTNIQEMFEYWKVLGLLTGNEKNSIKMVSDFKQKVKDFKELSGSIKQKKRVYFEAIHTRMKTFTKNSMAMFVLETSGGFNVASDAKQVRNTNIAIYGKERILSKCNEIDVFLAQKGVMNMSNVNIIKNESGFRVIKAVRNNQIFFVDEKIVSRPSFRLLNGIYEIGTILYPDVYKIDGMKILNSEI